jgi:two-component system, chemotaxis family, sensor kinase CheA
MAMDDIVKDFLVESHENLDQLDRDLVALEQDPTSHALLSSIFRTIHTIKGTCGFLSFAKLESVAHVGENLLSSLRDGHLRLNAEITSALLAMVDAIRQMLASIEESGQDGENDYPELIAMLARLQESPSAVEIESPATIEPAPQLDDSIQLLQSEEPSPQRKKRSRKARATATTTELALIPSQRHISTEGRAEPEETQWTGLAKF